jgi:hypothetical protein
MSNGGFFGAGKHRGAISSGVKDANGNRQHRRLRQELPVSPEPAGFTWNSRLHDEW